MRQYGVKQQAGVSVYVEEARKMVAVYDAVRINTLRNEMLRVLQDLRQKTFHFLNQDARLHVDYYRWQWLHQ